MASNGRSTGPNCRSTTIIGQSYRLTREPGIFPDGTGLTDRFSDIVGRTRVRFGRLVDLTHRFRLDKDNLAFRRNELDLTVGTDQTYAQIGYLRLNRDISPTIEDLRDKEELRLAGRLQVPALLVGVRRDRARPHRPATKIRCRWPTGSSRCAIASASLMKTNALSLAWRGGATMSASGSSERAAHSPSTSR